MKDEAPQKEDKVIKAFSAIKYENLDEQKKESFFDQNDCLNKINKKIIDNSDKTYTYKDYPQCSDNNFESNNNTDYTQIDYNDSNIENCSIKKAEVLNFFLLTIRFILYMTMFNSMKKISGIKRQAQQVISTIIIIIIAMDKIA